MIDNTTIYWILGIIAFLLLGFTHFTFGMMCYFASKRPGCIVHEELLTDVKSYIDPESIKPASTVGFMLVRKASGPYGIFRKWETIPEPFIVRDKDGKPRKLYSPRDDFIRMVRGFVEAEVGDLIKAEMEASEYKVRYAEEKVRNDASVETQLDKRMKHVSELVPYGGLNKPKKTMGGGGGGYNSAK